MNATLPNITDIAPEGFTDIAPEGFTDIAPEGFTDIAPENSALSDAVYIPPVAVRRPQLALSDFAYLTGQGGAS